MAQAFGTTGSTAMTAAATSASVNISAAATGDWVYCWVSLGVNSGAVSASGWTSLLDADEGTSAHYALLRRQKQAGDTSFTFSWTTSTKGTLGWASWSGLNSVTPDEGAALATNGLTSRTAVPSPSATPTTATRWAVAFFGARTTNTLNKPITWTPDAATTERLDVDNNAAGSAPWVGIEIADTNAAVTQAAHSYTASHNVAESHDGSAILFLIPAVTVNGDAALSGSGTLAAAGAPVVAGSDSLTGSGSASAAATVTALGSTALTGAGALAAQGRVDVFGAAALAGTGVLMADGHVPGFNVLRPFLGTVTRPFSGAVTRPNTGTVTRPRTET